MAKKKKVKMSEDYHDPCIGKKDFERRHKKHAEKLMINRLEADWKLIEMCLEDKYPDRGRTYGRRAGKLSEVVYTVALGFRKFRYHT